MNKSNTKVAYVTGGTSGIGLAIVHSLANDGYAVGFSSRSEDRINETLSHSDHKDQLLGIVSDVTNYEEEQRAIETVVTKFGRLDVVVANAGIGHFAPIQDLTPTQWNETIATNLTGVFNTTKASIAHLEKSGGYLITIASLAGTNFFETGAAYNASKFGLVGFTQAAMLDLRKLGIKVTTIMPGSVATHFNNHKPSEKDGWKIQPQDIGRMLVDLLRINPRTLPSKIEVRPSFPHLKP